MNKFIRQSLEAGEEIVYNGRLHWSVVFGYYFWSVVLVLVSLGLLIWGAVDHITACYVAAAVALVVALGVYFWGYILRSRSEFVVTNTRFIQKDGILNVRMTEIPLIKVETVNFSQTFAQRLLGTGCVTLVGSGGTSHQIHAVEEPLEVRKCIVSTINKQLGQKVPQASV